MHDAEKNINAFLGALTYKHYLGITFGFFLTLAGVFLQLDHITKTQSNRKGSQTTPSISKIIGERGEVNIEGTIYRGSLTDNLTGFGEIIWLDLTSYRGEIKKGLPDGEGEINYPSGKTYRGKLQKGKIQGLGEMQWSDGEAYEVRRLLSVFIALHCLIFCAVRRVNGRTAHEKVMAQCFLPTAMYLWGTLRTMHDTESEYTLTFSPAIRKYQIMLSESV